MVNDYKFGVLHAFNGINGGTYDAIDFVYTLNLIGKTKLILYRNNKKYTSDVIKKIICDIINKKYIVKMNFDIEVIDKVKIDRNKYKAILFIDADSISKIPIYSANKYIILADPYMPIIKNYFKYNTLPNVYTFNEMPFFPAPINYKFKFAFSIYKKYNELEDNTLISYKELLPFEFKHQMILINNKTNKQKELIWPVEDFHSKFNKYIYNNINYFDPRPRMFHECVFHGININDITRNIKVENYDGAYYRILDLKNNGLNDRYLDINDEVIQVMIN